MKRFLAAMTMTAFAWACASAPRAEWRRIDGATETEEIRQQRAEDLADCATRVGAPTYDAQSTQSRSRSEVEDCMRRKGWRRVPVAVD